MMINDDECNVYLPANLMRLPNPHIHVKQRWCQRIKESTIIPKDVLFLLWWFSRSFKEAVYVKDVTPSPCFQNQAFNNDRVSCLYLSWWQPGLLTPPAALLPPGVSSQELSAFPSKDPLVPYGLVNRLNFINSQWKDTVLVIFIQTF